MSKWYEKPGAYDDIILSTRVRLARNIEQLPFHTRITDEQRHQLNHLIREALSTAHFGDNPLSFIALPDQPDVEILSLVENHAISPDFAERPENKLLVLSKNHDISIMVGEEDHLRIQVMQSGLALEQALQLANQVDDLLDEHLTYAFDEEFGYLTACPTNLGTGLRASVMIHLPALEKANAISQLANTIAKLGLTIRGTYGEGSRAKGSVYQISNQITLGISEEMAIQNLQSIVLQIVTQERSTREAIWHDRLALEDLVYRSLGVLRSARLLSGEEYETMSSNVRLGASMGVLQDFDMAVINRLNAMTGSATICLEHKEMLQPAQRDAARAALVRRELGEYSLNTEPHGD